MIKQVGLVILGWIYFYWESEAAVCLQAGRRTDCIYILQLWGPQTAESSSIRLTSHLPPDFDEKEKMFWFVPQLQIKADIFIVDFLQCKESDAERFCLSESEI